MSNFFIKKIRKKSLLSFEIDRWCSVFNSKFSGGDILGISEGCYGGPVIVGGGAMVVIMG